MKRTADETIVPLDSMPFKYFSHPQDKWHIPKDHTLEDLKCWALLGSKRTRELVTLNADTLMFDALESVLSVPVVDEHQKFLGFFDVTMAVKYALKMFSDKVDPHAKITVEAFEKLQHQGEPFANTPIKKLLETPKMPHQVSRDDSVFRLLEIMQTGVHRVVVIEDDKPVGIVTQSDIMTLLYYNQHLVGDDYWKEIGSIDVTTRNPVTIDVTSKVINAYQAITDNHVSAVAVVSEGNKLVCTLSATDIKGLGQEDCKFSRLLLNIEDYFIHRAGKLRTPVTATMSNSLGTVISKMVMFRVHRIWITDEANVLTAVVSLSDIISWIVHKIITGKQK